MSKLFFNDKSYLYRATIVLCLILVMVCSIFYYHFYKNQFTSEAEPKLQIIVNGGKQYNSEIYEEFKDEGITLTYGDKKIPEMEYIVQKEGEVDTNTIGEYEIKYTIIYEGETYEEVRNVSVKDTKAPEIITNVDKIERYYCDNVDKTNFTLKVVDNFDGDITDKVYKEEVDGKYIIKAVDSNGNESEKVLPVEVTEEPAPLVNLVGNKVVYIYLGGNYIENGARATDGCGKPIDAEVSIDSNINVNKLGTYTVNYTVKYNGKEGKASRKVEVFDKNNLPAYSGEQKIVYLTFDDGPCAYTEELLNVLDKYDVKATFFVTNQFPSYQHMIAEEARRGHTVAVHTYSHKWTVYNSVDAYREDFNAMNDIIEAQTGKRSRLFRFPGGSSNTISKKYSIGVVSAIKASMEADGYIYFDWNVDSNDAGGAGTQAAYENVINGISNKKESVVLMHDIHKSSIPAVEQIIQYGLANGYVFRALDENSPTAHHGIRN